MPLFRKGLPTLVVAALACLVHADDVRAEGSAVLVNGEPVIRLLTSSGGLSPNRRATLIAGKLEGLAVIGLVEISGVGAERTLLVNGEPVLTITAAEAKRHGATAPALAKAWAARLQRASAMPPLQVSDNYVRLAEGGTTTIRLKGSEAWQAKAETGAKSIATVQRVAGGIRIHATGAGHTIVTVTTGGAFENVDVEVKPYAAKFPQRLRATVTGAPATATTVRGAVEGAINTQLSAVANAHWTVKSIQPTAVGSGATHSYTAKVWAAAPGAFPASGTVTVTVHNAAIPAQTDSDLWYSNNPETVRQPGPLFSASLARGRSARLLYHHLNGTTQDLFVRVQVINESEQPARVVVIPGDSKPDRDPVRAGMTAADQFVRNWIYGSGEVVTIPAKSTMPISLRRLSPNETASGLCSLRLVDGAPDLVVRTDAFPPFPIDERWKSALYSSTPWREVGTHPINAFDLGPSEASEHIYPNPYKTEEVAYQVGGRYGFVRIGQKPIVRQDQDGSLDGNFGVIYNIKARMENPTPSPTDVEVVFEASAGYSGGLFVVNGRYLRTPLLAPKTETRLARVRLSPGASQTIDITTLPLSGSSYPATLTIRPIVDANGALHLSRP